MKVNWRNQWKRYYLAQQWFDAFYLWAKYVKGEVGFDIDSDLGERLMHEYSEDPEIDLIMQQCWQVMGIE